MYTNLKITLLDRDNIAETNFFCKVCSYPLITQKDFSNNEKYKCCEECYLTFVQSRREEWKKGFKIDKSDLSKYLNIRKQLHEKIVNITGD